MLSFILTYFDYTSESSVVILNIHIFKGNVNAFNVGEVKILTMDR